MWSHHLLVALRALRRDAGYALLNGVGLAVALTCCVLIGLYARSELTFDRFHRDADRIVVVAAESMFGQEHKPSVSTPFPLHQKMQTDALAVDAAAMASSGASETAVIRSGQPVVEADVMFASAGFFDVLDFPTIAGDPVAALSQPDGAVVTESAARRLFGSADVVGQRFRTEARSDTQDVAVAAVVADPPRTSSLQFDVVLSSLALSEDLRAPDGWYRSMWMTLARLAPGASAADLDRQLAEISKVHGGATDDEQGPRYTATPLTDYHLSDLSPRGGFVGNPLYVALFSAAAGLVLLLGFINYVNLATARAARRAREIGVRKALGAGRWAIAGQFLVEAVVLTVLSGLAALALAALLLPAFNAGFETELALADLDAPFLVAGLAFVVLVGLAAGAYPAAVLARFDPGVVLRGGSSRTGRPSKNVLRRALVAVQFAVAIGLVAGTAVVLQQISFARTADLGVDAQGVVAIPLKPERGAGVGWQAGLDAIRQSGAEAVPTNDFPGKMRRRYSIQTTNDADEQSESITFSPVDTEPGYLDVIGARLVTGRDIANDDEAVVNQAYVRAIDWDTAQDAIGKTITIERELTVVGVVADYHFASMRAEVKPVAIGPDVPWEGKTDKSYDYVLARVDAAGVDGLRRAWAGLDTAQPFEPEFLDDTFAEMYDADRRLAGVIGGFALVALLVACLGLVGLAAYTAQRRTKEIGVRRALVQDQTVFCFIAARFSQP